jgi:small subunit ribosomal protein S4
MKRKHKIYSKPKRPFDKQRILEEAEIKKKFGLKNKKEIWTAESKIKKFREKAKKLISAGIDEQQKLFDQLNKIGLNVNTIGDVLALEKKDYLQRRLQTIVSEKFKMTPKTSRQLITHKHVLINDKVVNSPSYLVSVQEEPNIKLKKIKTKEMKKENGK